MLILVQGANGSGKSFYAERLAAAFSPQRYYLATMRPFGAAGAARVQRHRAQREGLGFITMELPCSLQAAQPPPQAVVLLEDVSNLLANAMFEQGMAAADVLADIRALCARTAVVVAVTISCFAAGDYDAETKHYLASLAWLNGELACLAESVVEMEDGVPFYRKGEAYAQIGSAMAGDQHI